MSNKYILHYSRDGLERDFEIEDFQDAVICEGRVFLRQQAEYSINTSPGQCWGAYVDVPAGSFLDGAMVHRGASFCIDDVGISRTVTEILSTEPLRIRTTRHLGVDCAASSEEEQAAPARASVAELECSIVEGSVHITGFHGAEHTLLIPREFNGLEVKRLDLRGSDLSKVEILIVSDGVEELALDFYTAKSLRRLELPADIKLLCPLEDLSATPWFRAQRPEPIFIADCYCGTPGGGSGGVRSLVIPEGIKSVASGADFHSYWHSIKTPASLRSIGRLAFATNHCLEQLNLGDGLETIGDGAFYTAMRLKSLYLPDSLTALGVNCFSRCFCLQDVSVPDEKYAERFKVHSLSIRLPDGEKHLSQCPPIVIPIENRISAWPARGIFKAAGREYRNLSELCIHPLTVHGMEYLDAHGRKTWLIRVRSDCLYDTNGERKIIQRHYIKTGDTVTQIEQVEADGTILVEEDINSLDIPYELRSIVMREVFALSE